VLIVRCLQLGFLAVFLAKAGANVAAGQTAPDSGLAAGVVGWRGNWTGRFPAADPPTAWYRRSKSPVSDIRYSARKPKGMTPRTL
jgi:hypothetical protein